MDVNGKPIQLDDKQDKILKEFRELFLGVKLPDSDDAYLLRWLMARSFDIDQAEKMLRTSLEWRQANQVDDIVDNWKPPEVMEKYFPAGICGHDKFGCPILINAYGRADMRGIVQSVSKKDYMRYIVYMAERASREMRRMSLEKGQVINKQVMIVDMDQLELRSIYDKRVMEYGMDTTKMSESHYPEALRRVYVINAPKVFTIFFNLVKTILHEVTVNKFCVFGTDSESWKAALLEEIDADQLPVYYGGTMTDLQDNAMFSIQSLQGGEVPRSYYMTSKKLQPTESMECVTISNGAKKKVEIPVSAVNSILRWQFMTEDADIGFHVYCMNGNDKVDVFPWERVSSHVAMEEGMTVCIRADTHYVEFDNSYSYLKSKKLWFTVTVEPPVQSQID